MRLRILILSTIVLSLLLIAVPALAAESGGSAGGEEDLTTGILLALVGGVILGIVAFVDSTTGENSLDGLQHDTH